MHPGIFYQQNVTICHTTQASSSLSLSGDISTHLQLCTHQQWLTHNILSVRWYINRMLSLMSMLANIKLQKHACRVPGYGNRLDFMKIADVRAGRDDDMLWHVATVCWWDFDMQLLNYQFTLHVQSSTSHSTVISISTSYNAVSMSNLLLGPTLHCCDTFHFMWCSDTK